MILPRIIKICPLFIRAGEFCGFPGREVGGYEAVGVMVPEEKAQRIIFVDLHQYGAAEGAPDVLKAGHVDLRNILKG